MEHWGKDVDIKTLEGKVIDKITGLKKASEEVRIHTKCGQEYLFYHYQDCCECVELNDFEADADDFYGALITTAEEVEGETGQGEYGDTFTWTFYKIETSKGGIWMRWLGSSNGYYSESVSFVWANKPEGK